MPTLARHSYPRDFAAWAFQTADLIKQGQFQEVDVAALADEVRDVARSEQRALNSQFRKVLAHLLKWAFQPEKRTPTGLAPGAFPQTCSSDLETQILNTDWLP